MHFVKLKYLLTLTLVDALCDALVLADSWHLLGHCEAEVVLTGLKALCDADVLADLMRWLTRAVTHCAPRSQL